MLKTEGIEDLFEIIASAKSDVLIDMPAGGSAATERFTGGGAEEGSIDWQAVGRVCDLFSDEECYNFFRAAGYEAD